MIVQQTSLLARHIAVGWLLLGSASLSQAQQATPEQPKSMVVNYVRVWDAARPDTARTVFVLSNPFSTAKISTQYVDGLGRPLQTVIKKGAYPTAGNPVDLVNPVIYDDYGREAQKYLPFAANTAAGNTSVSDGVFKLNAFHQDSAFSAGQYNGETWFYGQTNFEASPLNRPQESFAPGNSWVGSSGQPLEANRRSVKQKYWINTFTDSVRIWNVTDVANSFASYSTPAGNNGIYPAGQLYKNVTVDEHGKQVVEFKDKAGLVILKKVQLTAADDTGTGKGYHGWLCTYYIYDEMDRLRCVVQPRGVELLLANSWSMTALSNAILKEQCFRYEYDHRSRMIRKQVPGAGPAWMVYDWRNRLVLSQDSSMRSAHQWMYTQYDTFNRPLATGLITDNSNYNNLSYHIVRADTSSAYPNLANYAGYEELTRTFYDDYSWRSSYGNPLSATYSTSYNTYFESASNTVWPYAQSNTQSSLLKGLVTGTRTKVLGTVSTYLYTVNFYDDKARVIQVQSSNLTGSTDIGTTQYAWNGMPLITIQKQEKASPNTQTIISVSKLSYDSLWRVVKLDKKVSHSQVNAGAMPGSWTTVAENEYDAIGQLKRKKLAPGYSGGAGLDSLSYDYNIRGWMLGLNRRYAKDEHPNNYFGFDLGYDKASNGIIGNQSYANPQYNGNIEGMVWKSKGDGEKRKYDFTYDAANRIVSADFNQYTGSVFNKSAGVDFSMSGMSYDANGNILGMKQRGLKLTSSVTIDSLAYNYVNYSNKLLNVIDGLNDPQTKLGDFRTSTLHPSSGSKGTSTTDYSYDGNGNMVKDLNKDIVTYNGNNGIEYNHLNLPKKITVKKDGSTNKGYIEYTYDAVGNKLKKTMFEPGVDTTVTLYMGSLVFKNDTLEFIAQEEGRIRKKGTTQLVYDYMLKDHLGNVRMLLTTERDTSFYPAASLETANLSIERQLYAGIDTGRVNKSTVSGYPNDTYTSPNDFTQKLNGNGPKIGTNMVLKVMAGDKFNIFAKSWYKKNGATPGTPINPLNSLLNVLNPAVGGITSTHGGATLSELQTNSILNPAATSFLNSQSGYTTSKPKAFVNWVLFDEQFKYVAGSSGFEQVGADNTLTQHNLTNLTTSKSGYLYIYVSNETPNIDVFFDNLTVTHIRGPVLEETHYYPFGLTMAGISSKALAFGTPENKEKTFQGQRFDDELGLNWVQFKWRNHDPQIGRFIEIDPLAEKYEYNSTYAFSENKVTNHVELEGLESVSKEILDQTQTLPPQAKAAAAVAAGVVLVGEVIVNSKEPEGQVRLYTSSGTYIYVDAPKSDQQVNNNNNQKTTTNNKTYYDEDKILNDLGFNKNTNSTSGSAFPTKRGSIYKVPGDRTKSGKPYVGRTKHDDPAKRGSSDGRQRKTEDKIDDYDPDNVQEGRAKEQKQIDKEGLENLDNKRNEIKKPPPKDD